MDLFTSLVLAALFFIMGAAVVGIIWYLQGVAGRTNRKGKSATPPELNLEEIAHLMRDTQTQDLVVGINGKTFRAAHELSEGQQRRLNFTSGVLAKWLAETPSAPLPEEEPALSAMPVEEPVTTSPEIYQMGEEWVPAESVPLEPRSDYTPPFMIEPAQEVKPVSTKLPDVVGGILNPAPKHVPEFKSIAMQINDILQDRLAGSAFEARGISVNDGPDRGVMVTLDGEKYPGVKDVPDEEVRNLIRSAVLEWEKMGKSGAK
jgi:hypothetical protein